MVGADAEIDQPRITRVAFRPPFVMLTKVMAARRMLLIADVLVSVKLVVSRSNLVVGIKTEELPSVAFDQVRLMFADVLRENYTAPSNLPIVFMSG